jgi:hypothetical protein
MNTRDKRSLQDDLAGGRTAIEERKKRQPIPPNHSEIFSRADSAVVPGFPARRKVNFGQDARATAEARRGRCSAAAIPPNHTSFFSKTMTRKGKVARLPMAVREQLNQRIRTGEQGKRLVAWLNTLPEVKDRMAELFGGFPMREQNLSQWKKGGYRDWLFLREAREVSKLLEWRKFDEEGCRRMLQGLSRKIVLLYGAMAKRLLRRSTDEEEFRLLRLLTVDLDALRRTDCAEIRLQTERKRLEIERKRLAEDGRSHQIPVEFFPVTEEKPACGSASLRSRPLRQEPKAGRRSTSPAAGGLGPDCSPVRVNQAQSNQIRVNQPSRSLERAVGTAAVTPTTTSSRGIRAGPGASDRNCRGKPQSSLPLMSVFRET